MAGLPANCYTILYFITFLQQMRNEVVKLARSEANAKDSQ